VYAGLNIELDGIETLNDVDILNEKQFCKKPVARAWFIMRGKFLIVSDPS